MGVVRMDNVAIVVEDLDAAIAFFAELGLEFEGRQEIEGDFADQCVGLDGVCSEIAMMRTPDGQGRVELTTYAHPLPGVSDPAAPPPNTIGLHRIMFAVDDIDDTVARLEWLGGEVLGQVANYQDVIGSAICAGRAGLSWRWRNRSADAAPVPQGIECQLCEREFSCRSGILRRPDGNVWSGRACASPSGQVFASGLATLVSRGCTVGPVHITEIRLEGIRGFPGPERGVDLVLARKDMKPPSWVVVAGRNGAGKSTFLQALALSVAGPSVARLLAETFTGWIRDGEPRALAATRLRFSDEDGFAAGRKPEFDPWTAIEWTRADGPEPIMEKAPVGGNWTPSRGPWAENPRGWFTAGYGPFRRLSPAPTEAQRLMMLPGRPSGLASLFREDASLSESVRWLQQVYLRRLEGRADAEELERLVLNLLDDGLLPEGMRVQRVDSEGLWVKTPDGQAVALKALSDGYRTVAGLVLDLIKQLDSAHGSVLYESDANGAPRILHEGVVFIDEIDVHLHVEWQKRIGFWLKEHFPNIQFVVTTHSPFICQAADEGGLIRLAPAWADGVAAEIVAGEAFNRVVNGSADDAILSDVFGLESTLSTASLASRSRLAVLEAVALAQRLGDAELAELRELREQMPTSQQDRALRAVESLEARRLD